MPHIFQLKYWEIRRAKKKAAAEKKKAKLVVRERIAQLDKLIEDSIEIYARADEELGKLNNDHVKVKRIMLEIRNQKMSKSLNNAFRSFLSATEKLDTTLISPQSEEKSDKLLNSYADAKRKLDVKKAERILRDLEVVRAGIESAVSSFKNSLEQVIIELKKSGLW